MMTSLIITNMYTTQSNFLPTAKPKIRVPIHQKNQNNPKKKE